MGTRLKYTNFSLHLNFSTSCTSRYQLLLEIARRNGFTKVYYRILLR